MKKFTIPSLLSLIVCGLIASCSSDAVTDALYTGYSEESVVVRENSEGGYTVEAKYNVILTNRTERAMNIMFREGTIVDAKTGEALVRFTPIVPDSYGSTSTVQLLSKQTQTYPVVTPIDLYGFNPASHPEVMLKMYYNTEGYRTESVSGAIRVEAQKAQ